MSELTGCDHDVIMSRFLIMKHFGGSALTTKTFNFKRNCVLWPARAPVTKKKKPRMLRDYWEGFSETKEGKEQT